ncbi:MAG: hypothetical protein KIC64_09340, partial [Prevotella buccae]|uniref:hypothetical protein n=1 Tax=Segatella buccae TaxID=28126 RepID=UPI0024330F23
FLPFKKKADATCRGIFRITYMLFLPFKKKADATFIDSLTDCYSCFYLSKRRQMQLVCRQSQRFGVVFTFQKEGRCN